MTGGRASHAPIEPAMITVIDQCTCIGFLLHRGPTGVEAFNARSRIHAARCGTRRHRRGGAAMTSIREPRSIFTLRLEGKPGAAGIRALRFLLKRLLRQYGFVALDVCEETEPERVTITQVFNELRHDVARRAARNSPHLDEKETSS
jgi:hypothetical protein